MARMKKMGLPPFYVTSQRLRRIVSTFGDFPLVSTSFSESHGSELSKYCLWLSTQFFQACRQGRGWLDRVLMPLWRVAEDR